jgi:hypothetical protein
MKEYDVLKSLFLSSKKIGIDEDKRQITPSKAEGQLFYLYLYKFSLVIFAKMLP